MDPIDHPVSRYALDVVEGREVAGELVRLSCLRHLTDLETGRDRGLFFDCKAASRIINFSELIQHTTGPMGGQPLKLQPWQVFRHGSVFGWKREQDGLRRFRTTYHQVAKKNGKTTDTAVPALYTQLFDGELAPQGYCAATTRDQAGLLFKELKRMIMGSPALSQLMKPWRASIEIAHRRRDQVPVSGREYVGRDQPAFCRARRGAPLDRPGAGRGCRQLDDCPGPTNRLGDHDGGRRHGHDLRRAARLFGAHSAR